MKELIFGWIKSFYGIDKNAPIETLIANPSFQNHEFFWMLGLLVSFSVLFWIIWFCTRQIMLLIVKPIAHRSKTKWDDYLIENNFFKILANLVPVIYLHYFFTIVFFSYPNVLDYSIRFSSGVFVIILLITVRRFLDSIGSLLKNNDKYKDKPIGAYIQTVKLIVTLFFIIILLSVLTNQSPLFFLTSIGAMTAIILLIFKDTILGFVGSIQITANDMVRVGDWIAMEKFGADGFVQEITLTTVKVQNWDKTITTIPTYSLISDSFVNWRGMTESGGRRIKRSINIKIDTIKFADQKLIEKLSKVKLLSTFIEEQQKEINAFNHKHGLIDEYQINARRPTNVGLFRRYIEYYIINNPSIHTEMWRIVRHLQPTSKGLPIEIYTFSAKQGWADYEPVMADIFDHIFAVIGFFELEIHQDPTGSDIRFLKANTDIIEALQNEK